MTSSRCANCICGYVSTHGLETRCPYCVDGWVPDPAFYEPDPLFPLPEVSRASNPARSSDDLV